MRDEDWQQSEDDTMELMVLSAIQSEQAIREQEEQMIRDIEDVIGTAAGVNDDMDELQFVIQFTRKFLRDPRVFINWELCAAFGLSAKRFFEIVSPRLLQTVIDDLGDGSFQPKPQFLREIMRHMSENGGDENKALLKASLLAVQEVGRIYSR